MYKPKVTAKVQELNNLINCLQCIDHDEVVAAAGTYVYDPKSLTGTARLSYYHKLYGNSIKNVRSALLNVARKEP
jgi:succinate dehydrogenase/fumarate reductase-like Fe-S protein